MEIIKSFFIFFKYLLKSKWKISLPKKNKFVLVDGLYNPFLEYLKKEDFTILYRRGEEINFAIILKCLLKFKFTTLDYCVEFIRYVSPKLILTAFDYHTIFYKLSERTGIRTLMLQKGKRAKTEELIKNAKFFFPNKEKFFVDYILVYTDAVQKFYEKKINGKFFKIGSFENNFTKPKIKEQKKEIVYISNFSPLKESSFTSENEDIVAYELYKLAIKNKMNFKILPRWRKSPEDLLNQEKKFYKETFENNVKFILNKNQTSYEILLKYKYVFATYSTLAQECLIKGIRVGFIMFKSKKNPAYGFKFGEFEKFKKIGVFWTAFNRLDRFEIKRVFNFVTKTSNQSWRKKTIPYLKKIMYFDYKNKTFKKIIKENT